jgi:hypothetical protein
MLNFMLCNTTNVTTLYKADSFKQTMRSSPEDRAVPTQKCRRYLVKNICIQLYNVH